MISQKISGNSKNGIGDIIPHIVQTACAFQSSIMFEMDNKRVNAKSIMGVMALASQQMDSIEIHVDGTDEKDAMKAIVGLLG